MRTADRRIVLGLYRTRHDRDLLEAALELGITELDTAFNYRRFASHAALAKVAPDLLDLFEVTTKVGYFPHEHSLDPSRLRTAVEQSAHDLGRPPNAVLLHNAEHDPAGVPAAAEVLLDLRAQGLCTRWGISAWDVRPLIPVLTGRGLEPDIVMLRAGITVPASVLSAADAIAKANPLAELRGMAPFVGDPDNGDWSDFDAGLLLQDGQSYTSIQARFAAAFSLPQVRAVAVGSGDRRHLTELVEACNLKIHPATVDRYRELLGRATTVATTPSIRSSA